jgi:hypothetical protein
MVTGQYLYVAKTRVRIFRMRNKRQQTRRRSAPHATRKRVKTMRARGLSEDRIAYELSLSKNTLRARHAPDLDAGREAARAEAEAAERAGLSKRGSEIWGFIHAGFGTEWQTPDLGNLLQGGAKTPREAFARWLGMYGRTMDDLNDDERQVAELLEQTEETIT